MKEIVVGVDGSASSNRALEWALDEARSHGDSTVVLVHAYSSPEKRNPYAHAYPYLPADSVKQLAENEQELRDQQEQSARQHAEALLDRALEAVGDGSTDVGLKRVVVARDPSRTLVEMSHDADLLVVGSRGRGGFKGLLLGSVSQQCMHHAQCPVVVVR